MLKKNAPRNKFAKVIVKQVHQNYITQTVSKN